MTRSSSSRIDTVHFGPMGDLPGGMAQVVNEYLSWEFPGIAARGVRTTKGRGDRLALFRWMRALGVLAGLSVRRRDAIALVHISARGAFIREGSLVVLAKLLRIPVGIHLHGSEFVGFARKQPALVGFVCRSANSVFALTDQTLEVVNALVPSSRVRKVKIVNAVRMPSSAEVKRPQVLFGGEVGTRKGVDLLLEAWRRVAPRAPGWTLLIAGPAAAGFDIGQIPEHCQVLGAVNRAESMRLQSQSAIAALPSRHEALPMFLIESMANSCAVIGTDVGQIRELVSDVGIVIDPDDSGALADAIERLIHDEPLRERCGADARERIARNYSEEAVRGVLESEWKSIRRRNL